MLISQSGVQSGNSGYKPNVFNYTSGTSAPSIPAAGFTYFTINQRGTLLSLDFVFQGAGAAATNYMPILTIDDIDYDLSAVSGANAHRPWFAADQVQTDNTTTNRRAFTITGPIRFRTLAFKARSLSTTITDGDIAVSVVYGT